ncbi:MAG: NMD3-related protein [Candidatus Nezhaarchaeales archaeon]
MKRFCARCGADIGLFEATNLGNLCLKCYMEVHKIAEPPRMITMTVCRKCFSIKFKGKWQPLDLSSEESTISRVNQAIISEIERACKLKMDVSLAPQDVYKLFSGEQITVKATLNEKIHPSLEPIIESRDIEVKCVFSICPTCLKIVGKRFEATIQLRGFNTRELDQIKSLINKLILDKSGGSHNIQTGAVWEEVDGGVDVKLPSTDIARKIVSVVKRHFKVQMKESYKDAGWDKSRGKPLRKLTILLRSRNT